MELEEFTMSPLVLQKDEQVVLGQREPETLLKNGKLYYFGHITRSRSALEITRELGKIEGGMKEEN